MANTEQSIASVRDGASIYWAFYDPKESWREWETVEVRLDASVDAVAQFAPSAGWRIYQVKWGDTLFLRRKQPLDRKSVENMLVEVLQVASRNGMQFHSWLHGPDIDRQD